MVAVNGCGVCGGPFYGGRPVFRCDCKIVTHAHCWETHVIKSHRPQFTIGTITNNDIFSPNQVVVGEEGEGSI